MIYACKECGVKFPTEELAKQCEDWCKEHKSCNLELMKQSIQE